MPSTPGDTAEEENIYRASLSLAGIISPLTNDDYEETELHAVPRRSIQQDPQNHFSAMERNDDNGHLHYTNSDVSAQQRSHSNMDRRQRRDNKVVGMKHFVLESIKSDNPGEYAWKSRRVSMAEHEAYIREHHETRAWILWAVDMFAALKVMMFFLVTMNSLVVCGITGGLTVFWYYYAEEQDIFETSALNWILLSFAIITPMSVTIRLAFQRRERALLNIARIRSFSYQIYLAHCLWNWSSGGGREASDIDWLFHSDCVLAELVGIGDELSRFLSLPCTSLSRHRMTRRGRNEAARTIELGYRLFDSLYTERAMRISKYAERLKGAGLSATECSRIHQYERFIGEAIEDLRMIKWYRTPEALRSFARIFIFLLPPFYAPTYAQLAHDLDNLGVGIAFGIITALGLTALFEGIQVLEDPFVAFLTLEGIDVHEEFEVLHWHQLVMARSRIFPFAPPCPPHALAQEKTDSEVSFGTNEEFENDNGSSMIDMFAEPVPEREQLDSVESSDIESGDSFSAVPHTPIRTSHYARDLVPAPRAFGLKRRSSEHGMRVGRKPISARGPGRPGFSKSTRSLDG